jgi:S1-C subfamily serine protease
VTTLDVVLLSLLALSAWGGYRRGAVLQVIGLAGLILGFVVGAWLAPHVADLVRSEPAKVIAGLGTVLVLGGLGDGLGSMVGLRLRRRTRGTRLRGVDAGGGSLLSIAAFVLAVWFVGLNLAAGPFPEVARALQRSAVVRTVGSTLPPPPALTARLGGVLDLFGFPEFFSGLPPLPAEPVPQPTTGYAARAAEDARPSLVLISGPACDRIVQGTGFVVGPGLVLTNAHVVAGGTPRVEWNGRSYDAVAVHFDEDLDAAILRVAGLDAPPLTLLPFELRRGAAGAVLGFPEGGYSEQPAAVRRAFEVTGRDIYGRGGVRRRIYELQATVRSGSSGSPFVLDDGRVAGMVFGASASDPGLGYAVTSPRLIPIVDDAARADEVGTGRCAA